MRVSRVRVTAWSAAAATALLWPARALGLFDGMPLDGAAEALVLGLVVPTLWWLDKRVLTTTWARAVVVALLAVKSAGLLLTPQGLCARFSTAAPLAGEVQTIPIDEPSGVLRSWDVRADWRAPVPACTAIVDRSYPTGPDFPAWFVNVLDFIRPGRVNLALDVAGVVRVPADGRFSLQAGPDMSLSGVIGAQPVVAAGGQSLDVTLPRGVHPISLHATLTGERWLFEPRWNERDAWRAVTFTTAPPRAVDAFAGVLSAAASVLTMLLVGGWAWSIARTLRLDGTLLAAMTGGSIVMLALVAAPRFARLAGLVTCALALVPLAPRHRNVRGAFLVLGVPWLVFFAAQAFPLIGRFTAYSADDWLTYQVAGYRIFMHGYWLEAGSRVFDYQPLYRWISGALHVVFGDSSVGETYLDAACLLAGGLLAFHFARLVAGYRAGLIAAGLTLATFTLGTIWYFVGRGLSEIAAAGFACAAMSFVLRARLGRPPAALAAGVCAVLMFYTRLNYLIFAVFLPVLLLPLRTPAVFRLALPRLMRIRIAAAALYSGVFAAGALLFVTRTWWFTGVFSLFYGTSLKNNDTGLRVSTLGSAAVWERVGHSLSALVWMNEPPHVDPRATVVALGVLVSVLALLQAPTLKQLPASLAIVTLAAMASAFFAHTHNYPGRMSIHLVPLTSAAAVLAIRAVGSTVFAGVRRRSAAPDLATMAGRGVREIRR